MLSEVPEGWSHPAPLSIYASNATRKWNEVEALPYIGLEHIEQRTGQLLGVGESQSVTSAKNLFEPGDVLFGKLRPNLRKYWKAGRRGICSTDILVLRSKQGLESSYLFAVVQSEPFLAFAENDAAGTKMPRTSWKRLETIKLSIPPLKEQHRIAEILSSVDTSIQATQAVIEQAERVKRGLMEELLTGGLGSEAIERGEVPAGWELDELKECFSKVIDYRGKAPPKAASGIPLITAKNIRKGFLSFKADEYIDEEQYEDWMVRGLPQAGDVMFTTEAPLGNVAQFPSEGVYALGQRVITLRCNERLKSSYLFYLLQSKFMEAEIQSRATGSTAKGIKSKEFQKIKVPFPNTAEQLRIAQILSSFDASIAKQKNILEQHVQTKRGLMDDLLTGKVRTVL